MNTTNSSNIFSWNDVCRIDMTASLVWVIVILEQRNITIFTYLKYDTSI